MTLLTVDAKLMPILPLIARRIEARSDRRVRDGYRIPLGVDRGTADGRGRTRPFSAEMFGHYYADADACSPTRRQRDRGRRPQPP